MEMVSMKKYNSLIYRCNKIKLGCSVSAIALLCLSYCTQDTVDVKIVDKYIKTEPTFDGESSKGVFYLVGEKKNGEIEVFQNSDSLPFFKFNSSDVQQQFDVGQTYRMNVNWMRVPFFSMYRNVISGDLIIDEPATESKGQTMDARYASALLQMIDENPTADVAEMIQVLTQLEAVKDKQNATKIKAIGNKYYTRYMQMDSIKDFKQLLKEAAQGKSITKRIDRSTRQNLLRLSQNSK